MSDNFELLSELDYDKIMSFCANKNVTPNAFFNSVFAFVLSKYNYKTEAVYTTIYNGRSDSRLSSSVSMLVKTLPVYCALEGETDIAGLIKATGNQLISSMENDIYSFAEISRAYDIHADVMFAYQGDNFALDNKNVTEFWIGHDNSFTTKALYRLEFKWPIINEKYLANAFKALDSLGFFREL